MFDESCGKIEFTGGGIGIGRYSAGVVVCGGLETLQMGVLVVKKVLKYSFRFFC